jgi:hypothetical protein
MGEGTKPTKMYACATIVKKKHRAAEPRILGRVGTQPHSKSSRDNDLANALSGLPGACRFCARSFGMGTESRKTDREAVMAILEGGWRRIDAIEGDSRWRA